MPSKFLALKLRTIQWDNLDRPADGYFEFSLAFPHAEADIAKKNMLSLIYVADDFSPMLFFGRIRSKQAVTTLETRVKFDLVHSMSPGSMKELLQTIKSSHLKSTKRKFAASRTTFTKISRKFSEAILTSLSEHEENKHAIQRILASVEQPDKFSNAGALQHDALKLALDVFGSDKAAKLEISDKTALARVHLHEDAVIEHDARSIEGWEFLKSDMTGRATFTKRGHRLEVITANKRPLENLFGADLIYINNTHNAIVMVQYKMLEAISKKGKRSTDTQEKDYIARVDQQFRNEINRMDMFASSDEDGQPFRLNSNPFYFKFVRRDALINTNSFLVALDHFKKLEANSQLFGPNGGVRISYRDLDGQYLRSADFVSLVSSGYIGSANVFTEALKKFIEHTLSGGSAVVVAIQDAMGKD